MRDPVRNGPAGRQVIGWSAFCFGVLGLVHIANGSPQPVSGDTTPLREGGGAVGFVVSSLLLDLLRSELIVVPLLVLLAFFGVLVITATPLYQVPERLAAARDRALGRHRGDDGRRLGGHPADQAPAPVATPTSTASSSATRRTTARCSRTASAGSARRRAEPVRGRGGRRAEPGRDDDRRARAASAHADPGSGSSSSRCPATSPTRCRPTTS